MMNDIEKKRKLLYTKRIEQTYEKYGKTFSYTDPLFESGIIECKPYGFLYGIKKSDMFITHRLDGPAFSVIDRDGLLSVMWEIDHKIVAKLVNYYWEGELYDWSLNNGIDLDHLSEEDINLIKISWG